MDRNFEFKALVLALIGLIVTVLVAGLDILRIGGAL